MMKVKLLTHAQLSNEFLNEIFYTLDINGVTDGQLLALTAIRTCYSHNKPSEMIAKEGPKYFGKKASDGGSGNDADRLIRFIVNSGHTSTLEHIQFSFAIEGVSRSLLAQITRHRHFSFSVQSQRYNKLETESKSGGFDYVIPPSIEDCKNRISVFDDYSHSAKDLYKELMENIQQVYDDLRNAGVSAEDARFVLPNAATCNLVLSANLRSLLEFDSKRSSKKAQWEIRDLAELMKDEIIKVEPWTSEFFK